MEIVGENRFLSPSHARQYFESRSCTSGLRARASICSGQWPIYEWIFLNENEGSLGRGNAMDSRSNARILHPEPFKPVYKSEFRMIPPPEERTCVHTMVISSERPWLLCDPSFIYAMTYFHLAPSFSLNVDDVERGLVQLLRSKAKVKIASKKFLKIL